MLKSRLIVLFSLLLLLSQFVGIVTADSARTIISGDRHFQGNLTVIQPNNSTVYNGTMPLNFTIDWTTDNTICWIHENTSYSIDDNPTILLQSRHVEFEHSFQVVTSKVDTAIDISNLETGEHKLTIVITGDYDIDNLILRSFNASFDPIYFNVDNAASPDTSNNPPPFVSEFPIFAVISLLIAILTVAGLVIYRKKHSTGKQSF